MMSVPILVALGIVALVLVAGCAAWWYLREEKRRRGLQALASQWGLKHLIEIGNLIPDYRFQDWEEMLYRADRWRFLQAWFEREI